jgi:glycosyltransferase involved in cell wall biosynthesis
VINARLAAVLAARGLTPERLDLSPGTQRRGVAYHLTRMGRALAACARLLTAPGPRRILMSVDGGGGLAYNILLALAARLGGRALLLYHHSTRYVLADSGLMRLLLAVAGRGVTHVFCSPQMAAMFSNRYGAQNPVLIVSNAAWVDPQTSGRGSANGLCLGFLSSLTLEKGLGRAIETLRAARARGSAARLILAGPLTDSQAQSVLAQAQTEFGPALELRGVLEGQARADFYAGLDVFLFPSLYPHETQSLVVPEALAAATPVIAHDHRFVGEMLGQAGLLIPAGEEFAARATDFVIAGRDETARQARREAALVQFQSIHAQAEGQMERLIAWASGAA